MQGGRSGREELYGRAFKAACGSPLNQGSPGTENGAMAVGINP